MQLCEGELSNRAASNTGGEWRGMAEKIYKSVPGWAFSN